MAELPYEDKAKCILENRKNANMLVDLLEKLDSNSKSELLEVISCLEKVFKGYFFQRLWQEQFETDDAGLYVPGDSSTSKMIHAIYHGKQDKDQALQNEKKEEKSQKNVERIFAEWAHKQYLNFVKELLQLCSHQDKNVQKSALESLMSFVVSDHNAAISSPKYDPKQFYFPGTLFSRIMDSVLFCEPHASDTLLNHFEQHYLKFIDIQFYTLKNILRVANGKSKSIAKNENVKNHLCALLLNMSAPKEEDDEFQGFVIDDVDRLQCISPNSKERKKLFSNTWLSLLRLKLPTQSLKKVLANLHENVMPQMEDPKLLIDFLTDCYDLEGPIALLALNGLFLLIQNYNLDYPDFFKKLYNLLDADIFGVKYRDRFFALADLFLTSLNLPAYMAAAFVKRLARISLRVSPDGIRIILVMIENLIKRHPSCKVLIHRKVNSEASTAEEASADPYKFYEPDPARCNALNSSLWELKTLEQHYSAEIQEAIKIFNQPFKRQERDLKPFLDSCYADVFDQELVSFEYEDDIPLNFKTPNQLFPDSTYGREFWSFE